MAHKRTNAIVFYFARELRFHLTPAERILWERLRDHRLHGLGFRRQHALGPFIVDFCCPCRKLTIEVDGATHQNQAGYDAARTAWLVKNGWYELRFSNREVEYNLDAVLETILKAVENPPPITKSRGAR